MNMWLACKSLFVGRPCSKLEQTNQSNYQKGFVPTTTSSTLTPYKEESEYLFILCCMYSYEELVKKLLIRKDKIEGWVNWTYISCKRSMNEFRKKKTINMLSLKYSCNLHQSGPQLLGLLLLKESKLKKATDTRVFFVVSSMLRLLLFSLFT